MLCISTVSARATGEIKSTWLGDVALIPGGGEGGRGTERGSRGRKEKKEVERKKREKARRATEVEEREGDVEYGQRLLFPAAISCWPGLLALSGCSQVADACLRKGSSMCFSRALDQKPLSPPNASNLPRPEAGGPAMLAAREAWEVPGCQVKVPRHKSRSPEVRAMTPL